MKWSVHGYIRLFLKAKTPYDRLLKSVWQNTSLLPSFIKTEWLQPCKAIEGFSQSKAIQC